MKKIFGTVALALIFILLLVGTYVAYVFFSYSRIPDNQIQTFDHEVPKPVPVKKKLTAVAFNLGFGAYVPEYSFFMDGGTESRAFSMQEATNAINGAMEQVKGFDPDFVFLQEIDIKADRSYGVNQLNLVKRKLPDFYTHEAINYDSAYLFWPLTDPIGKSKSSLVTSSRFPIDVFTRRSLPMPTGFTKLLDLDRCYTVSEIKVSNGKTLYLYNVHMIAYGGTDDIATQQVEMLLADMKEKLDAGNYVICGGDFNHDLLDSYARFNGEGHVLPGWAQPFPHDLIPEGILLLNQYPTQEELVPTSRSADKPYTGPKDAILVIIDGFLVSENVKVHKIENVDAQFQFSDHNPVFLSFSLLDGSDD